jgi:hypothetical protein
MRTTGRSKRGGAAFDVAAEARTPRALGALSGIGWVADDFDAPLELDDLSLANASAVERGDAPDGRAKTQRRKD